MLPHDALRVIEHELRLARASVQGALMPTVSRALDVLWDVVVLDSAAGRLPAGEVPVERSDDVVWHESNVPAGDSTGDAVKFRYQSIGRDHVWEARHSQPDLSGVVTMNVSRYGTSPAEALAALLNALAIAGEC